MRAHTVGGARLPERSKQFIRRVAPLAVAVPGSLAPKFGRPFAHSLSALRLHVTLADHLIFVNRELLKRHRAAGM
jgi:hypothetical protein